MRVRQRSVKDDNCGVFFVCLFILTCSVYDLSQDLLERKKENACIYKHGRSLSLNHTHKHICKYTYRQVGRCIHRMHWPWFPQSPGFPEYIPIQRQAAHCMWWGWLEFYPLQWASSTHLWQTIMKRKRQTNRWLTKASGQLTSPFLFHKLLSLKQWFLSLGKKRLL